MKCLITWNPLNPKYELSKVLIRSGEIVREAKQLGWEDARGGASPTIIMHKHFDLEDFPTIKDEIIKLTVPFYRCKFDSYDLGNDISFDQAERLYDSCYHQGYLGKI